MKLILTIKGHTGPFGFFALFSSNGSCGYFCWQFGSFDSNGCFDFNGSFWPLLLYSSLGYIVLSSSVALLGSIYLLGSITLLGYITLLGSFVSLQSSGCLAILFVSPCVFYSKLHVLSFKSCLLACLTAKSDTNTIQKLLPSQSVKKVGVEKVVKSLRSRQTRQLFYEMKLQECF